MPTFEDALRESVRGVTDQFRQTDRDLHEEVLAASDAVERLTNGRCLLSLEPQDVDEGAEYTLHVANDEHDTHSVLALFNVALTGYPIQAALWTAGQGDDSRFGPPWTLPSRAELAAFLTKMASHSTSRLVTFLAEQLRRQPALSS